MRHKENELIGGLIYMSDGIPNIAGPIGSLVGIGTMAYAAKGVTDVLKTQSKNLKSKQSSHGSKVHSSLNKMMYK